MSLPCHVLAITSQRHEILRRDIFDALGSAFL
jgi:hypothetical protein